jgi:hypothetical protein
MVNVPFDEGPAGTDSIIAVIVQPGNTVRTAHPVTDE